MKIPDPEAWAATVPAAVWAKWKLLYAIEPWGWRVWWRRVGTLCAVIANFAPFRGKDAKVMGVDDFVPPDAAGLEDPIARAAAAEEKALAERRNATVKAMVRAKQSGGTVTRTRPPKPP